MNSKLMHEPVLNRSGKPKGFNLRRFGPHGGPVEDTLQNTFWVCTNCRTVYQADGDDRGVCPAKIEQLLKEHVL